MAGRLVDEAQLSFAQADAQYRAAQEHLKTLESVRQDEIDVAAAQVKSAKAHVESQEAQVGYSRVESPISGIVSDRALNAGEMANAGFTADHDCQHLSGDCPSQRSSIRSIRRQNWSNRDSDSVR